MRTIPDSTKNKLLEMQQTVYNGANLSTDIKVLRPTTPLSHRQFLLEAEIAPVASTCTSVAVRRMSFLRPADYVYVAYVSSGTLYVRRARLRFPLTDMSWELLETISDVSQCTLEFDGRFVHNGQKVEFLTDETPWIFYSTTSGALYGGMLGGAYEQLAAANVTAVDAINGVSNTYDAQDQGFFVFYILNGTVYYNAYLDGAWEGQQAISLAPANAVALKAERTFDYRIVLQVMDNTGALTEIFTKMEATGWNCTDSIIVSVSAMAEVHDIYYHEFENTENITVDLSGLSDVLYALSPIMKSAYNISVEIDEADDFGYAVVLEWDERVFGVASHEASFSMIDEASAVFGCTSVEKTGDKQLILMFQNFNNAIGDLTLSYSPGTMTGDIVAVEADSIVFTPTGLVPFAIDPPVPVSVINTIEWEGN